MIATLLAAKTQNGTDRPAQAMANPPSAGPAARPMLKPAPFKAVAPFRSSLGTSIGVIAPQAGDVSAPPTPNKKVVANRSVGVARPTETKTAKTTDTAKIAVSTAMSSRRESRTSASAPAGKVKRNNGRLTATCTSETVIGLGSMLVISEPDAVVNIDVPKLDNRLN